MKHSKFIMIGLSLCIVTGSVVGFAMISNNLQPMDAVQNLYTLTLDGNDAITENYDTNYQTMDTPTDSKESTVKINYSNVMYSKKGTFGQFKSGSGTLYNVDPIHYIKQIQVNFTVGGDNKYMAICYGDSQNPSQNQTKITPTNNTITFNETLPHYFKLKANGHAAVVSSIVIQYFCVKGDFIAPDIESSSTSGLPPLPETGKNATISYNNSFTDNYIIPKSYNNTGLLFKIKDLNLFANYITYDYKSTGYIYLKENGLGNITNANAINGLKSISINTETNKENVELYVSNTFNSNWIKYDFKDINKIEINGLYKFFKIQNVGPSPFTFKRININYSSTDSYVNKFYKTKEVSQSSQEKVEASIKTSTQSFTNSQKWIIKGYAKNIHEAQNDVLNKQQSGYEGRSDYQIDFNPDVIYNNNFESYRVSDMQYGDNGESFRINMIDGSEGPVIYRDGIYTYIEDIAAYITAFGDVPKNMRYLKNEGANAIADWGINGRVNYTSYSNDDEFGKFKFETEVSVNKTYFVNKNEAIANNSYWYNYFENDYAASVWNDEPYQKASKFPKGIYNNGKEIGARGTLRFVWSKSFTNEMHNNFDSKAITNSYDRNVFFTNNHYNDFQQYLNYYGGWSMKFGNTTIGNDWDEYVENNHLHSSPYVHLVTLQDLNK